MRLFTIITRQLSRNRLYIFINLMGLSVAIAIGLLVYSFVVKEVQTDEFHRNGENIIVYWARKNLTIPIAASIVGCWLPRF